MHIYTYFYTDGNICLYTNIYVYAVYRTVGFSIIRCILSMLKNFLTYCHALRDKVLKKGTNICTQIRMLWDYAPWI